MSALPVHLSAIIVVAAVALSASWTGKPPERYRFSYVARSQTSTSLRVSAEFQSEIAQLAAGGLKLKEALEASLEGSAHHLAAVFQREKPKAPNEAFEFRIIESDGRTSRTIFKRTDFFFSFDLAGEANKLNATDINGDGMKEII